jgi:hypothetical protein
VQRSISVSYVTAVEGGEELEAFFAFPISVPRARISFFRVEDFYIQEFVSSFRVNPCDEDLSPGTSELELSQ